MKNLLFFNSMITPKMITFIYWALSIVIIVVSIYQMFSGYEFDFFNFFVRLLQLFAGIITLRIWCELMIVLFKINDNLQLIANKKNN
jgi:hypothetical protein